MHDENGRQFNSLMKPAKPSAVTAFIVELTGIRPEDLADAPSSFVPRLAEFTNVLVLKAFTKSFGMAGLRLGYCLSADEALLGRMSRAVQPWNVSIPAQAAGTAALKETAFLERTRALIKAPPELGEWLLQEGIRIRDCSNFHGLAEGFYRIAVKLPEENDRLISAIKETL